MRAVVQRVTEGSVTVGQETTGAIGTGFVVLLGVEETDTTADSEYLAEKIVGLRIFEDTEQKMNLSLCDVQGAMLVVSQFTLLGDARKGKRPSFSHAARPEVARALYEDFIERVRARGIPVAEGVFQAHMQVHILNDGPVTILLDSRRTF